MNHSSIPRVIDANANRAAEGLRTIEDIARLVNEDPVVTRWIKALRHRLGEILEQIDRRERLAGRSTVRDAGTEVHADGELRRDSWGAIVAAAAERVAQSLRGLEEATKLVLPELSKQIKTLRYESYDILARAELRLVRDACRLENAHICLLIDCQMPLDQFRVYVRNLAEAGVGMFQLRDKRTDGGIQVRYGRTAREALSGTACSLVINDRADVAVACNADGVHLGQTDLAIGDVRRMVGPDMWIGISTHSIEQAIEAEEAGADYIGCGPVFPSATKKFTEFAGLELLRDVAARVRIPWFAIGGINLNNLDQVLATNCTHIAVSQGVHASDDPIATVRRLHSELVRSVKDSA